MTTDRTQTFSLEDLRSRISRLPRERLIVLPTPLIECPRLSQALGGARVFVKRDDAAGLPLGGSMTRALEFILAEAKAHGADTLVMGGRSAQSDEARQVAAVAARTGMRCVLVLRPGVKGPMMQGNLLLDRLLGADVRLVEPPDPVAGMQAVIEDVATRLRQEGRKPYVIHPDVYTAVAYAECAVEIGEQLASMGSRPDYVFVASSGSTQAGLILGSHALEAHFQVVGVSPERRGADRHKRIAELAGEAAKMLGLEISVSPDGVTNLEEYVGVAYGLTTKPSLEALIMAARHEGIILDPVYTAKAFAALIDYIAKGQIGREQTAVFVHTGGIPAIFAYNLEISGALTG